MQKIFRNFLLIWIVLLCNSCSQQRIDPNSIETIISFIQVDYEQLYALNPLVIFDIDGTFFSPRGIFFAREHTDQAAQFRKYLKVRYPDFHDWDQLGETLLKKRIKPLNDLNLIDFVYDLRAHGASTLALSSMNTGKQWPYYNFEDWTHKYLQCRGFETSYQDRVFTIQSFEANPIFYKGLIVTDRLDKGPVVGAVIDELKVPHKQVVMFDEQLDNLESVRNECQKRGVNFIGFWLRWAGPDRWDEDLVAFQIDYLITNKRWLGDQAAKIEMSKHRTAFI